MRIMLTGANGQVGWELRRTLLPVGQVIPFTHESLDLQNPDAVRSVVRDVRPNLIVNAAAYTAVDKAETEYEVAQAVNGIAPGILAEEARKLGSGIIHFSTDYVFDGRKDSPYVESDVPSPLGVYGKSKLAGERAVIAVGGDHLVLRTSWVYGLRGHNFALTMLRLGAGKSLLRIVNDQFGAPTWSRHIAEATAWVIAACFTKRMDGQQGFATDGRSGVYHLTANGATTWFGFAKAIFDNIAPIRTIPSLVPIPTKDYPTPAMRPANSRLSNDAIQHNFGVSSVHWEISLGLCFEEIRNLTNNPVYGFLRGDQQ